MTSLPPPTTLGEESVILVLSWPGMVSSLAKLTHMKSSPELLAAVVLPLSRWEEGGHVEAVRTEEVDADSYTSSRPDPSSTCSSQTGAPWDLAGRRRLRRHRRTHRGLIPSETVFCISYMFSVSPFIWIREKDTITKYYIWMVNDISLPLLGSGCTECLLLSILFPHRVSQVNHYVRNTC